MTAHTQLGVAYLGIALLAVVDNYLCRGWPIAIGTTPDGKGPTYANWGRGVFASQAAYLLRRYPQAMLGVILGPKVGFWDLEIDAPEGVGIVEKAIGPDPPTTPMFQRSGGYPHRLFAWDTRLGEIPVAGLKVNDASGRTLVEFRLGHRGAVQSIFPPSGGRRWTVHPDRCSFAKPPSCLIEFILKLARRQAVPRTTSLPAARALVTIERASLSNATRHLLAFGAPQEAGWNNAIFAAACDLAGCGVPIQEAEHLLVAAAAPWNKQEERRALRTIRSGYSKPRAPARRSVTRHARRHHRQRTSAGTKRITLATQ